jgi:hypothetical protein
MRKILLILAIIGVLLAATNPTPTDFKGYLNTKPLSSTDEGRTSYFLFFSIYTVSYLVDNGQTDGYGNPVYNRTPTKYLGIFKNFIEISN